MDEHALMVEPTIRINPSFTIRWNQRGQHRNKFSHFTAPVKKSKFTLNVMLIPFYSNIFWFNVFELAPQDLDFVVVPLQGLVDECFTNDDFA